jgi:hypothetical protein
MCKYPGTSIQNMGVFFNRNEKLKVHEENGHWSGPPTYIHGGCFSDVAISSNVRSRRPRSAFYRMRAPRYNEEEPTALRAHARVGRAS